MRDMKNRITANLPALDFYNTFLFYRDLGFSVCFQDTNWMILKRMLSEGNSEETLEIEFFLHPTLNPKTSCFSACIRLDSIVLLDSLHETWSSISLPEKGIPRISSPVNESYGFRIFTLVDPNGSLLRCLAPMTVSMARS